MVEQKENDADLNNLIFADLHIHSKYSRACSKELNIENLVKWARVKGLNLLGTGDFTHPKWLEEIKTKLVEENGIFYYKDSSGEFPFILTSEISLVYTQNGKGRRVHLHYLAPSISAVEKINSWLDTKGRRDYDGRPIFKISCRDFAAKMEELDPRIEVIPAHCLLPNEVIHVNDSIKKIKDIKVGDLVLTHENRWRKVKEVLSREYKGKVYKIRPWYFSLGLTTTLEHPFYVIKSYKNCKSTKGLCKPLCSQDKKCRKKHYMDYKPEWLMAKDLEKGDFLVYPRKLEEKDLDSIIITDYIKNYKIINKNFIISKDSRNHRGLINVDIKVDKNFCLLLGYFLSEGYLIGKEAIGFSFHSKEKEYINDVIRIIQDNFGKIEYKLDGRRENQGDIVFYSKILNEFFSNFYLSKEKRSWNKIIHKDFLNLNKDKLAEILRGWWRGDLGYSVSRELINQMKIICLYLGIIPSIRINKSEDFNKNDHFIEERKIISKHDLFQISNLSFFEKNYGMLNEKCFRKSINKFNRKHGFLDENYIYIPIRKIEINNYNGDVYNLEVEEDNSYTSEFACIHNCWTPWFGVFGSLGGFDSLKEAFLDKTHLIHAVETGISSDPEMNWKIKDLDNISIVSSSDAHSFWPHRIGREATIFNKPVTGKLTYDEIIRQIHEKDFFGTIETDPAYGKYHFDGHRDCNFSCPPEETIKLNSICPVCSKKLIVGVEYRVNELEKQGVSNHLKKRFFYKMMPLHEIISLALGVGVNSKGVWKVYNDLIAKFGNEIKILIDAPFEEILKITNNQLMSDLIIDNREGKIQVKPGYDGLYGKVLIGGREVALDEDEKVEDKKEDKTSKKKEDGLVVKKDVKNDFITIKDHSCDRENTKQFYNMNNGKTVKQKTLF